MRIDRIRNQIAAARELLDRAERQLEDLHVLAYDRRTASERLAVRGGAPDYALDNHGSPEARELLRRGLRLADASCAELAAWSHDVLRFLNDGTISARRTRRSATAEEVEAALEAQKRRHDRGEYTPARIYPQPRPGT